MNKLQHDPHSSTNGRPEALSLRCRDIAAHPYIRATGLLGALTVVIIGAWLSWRPGREIQLASYLPLHTFLETCSIVVCVLVFVVSRAAFGDQRNRNMIFLGAAFLGVALLDFLHAQSYAGMPALVTPSGPEKAIDFWLAARLLSAAALVGAAHASWEEEVPASHGRYWIGGVLAGVALISWVILYHPYWPPRTFIPDQGLTTFKILAELAIAGLSLLAAYGFCRQSTNGRQPRIGETKYDPIALLSAAVVIAMGELFFAVYTDVNGLLNVLGHVYKLIGAWFLYRGLVAVNLHEVDTRNQLALDAAQLWVWSWDVARDAIERDDRAAVIGELPGVANPTMRDLDAQIHPEDLPAKQAAIRRALDPAGDGNLLAEYRVISPVDGSVRWISTRGKTEFRDGRAVRIIGIGRNITEPRKAIEAVKTSQARLAGILDIAADAIISVDGRSRITLFNQGAERIFGYASEEVMGQPIELLLPARFRASHEAHIRRFGASPQVARRMGERQEIWGLHKSGREFPAEASISKLDLGGETTFTVVLRDIAARVEREQAVQKSEERLALALQAGEIGLFEHDYLSDELYWSPIYRNILGVTASEPARLERFLQLVPPEDRSAIDRLMANASVTEGSGHLELEHRIIRPDGSLRWLARDVRSHFVGEGAERRVVRTIGAVRDITERKLAEQRLEQRVTERTAELSALLDALPDGIMHADTEGRILVGNTAMTTLFGYSREDLTGKSMSKLYASPSDAETVTRATRSWESSALLAPVTVECRRKNGTTFTAMVLGNAVRDANGKILSRVGIIRDITDEVKRQKALTQSQRMEAYGQLTGGIAHDFNNLLTVISGNQELLEMRLRDEKDLELLKRAQTAADMGARLTSRLLTFARRRPLAPTRLDLNEQISGMVDLLRRSIGEHVTLTTNLSPRLPFVQADASEIENAVLNLAINSRDAMPNGGTIVIETKAHTVDGRELWSDGKLGPGEYVRLSVSDTGAGMPPDVLARAFEPFFTTKQPGKGTGLGLSTIYGAIRQLGGTVTIYSEIGRGTTVNIFLPRAVQTSAPAPAKPDTDAVLFSAGEKVLLVEDNPDVREVARKRLEDLGYKVQEVETGVAAIELLQRDGVKFDLVLSDVVMPGGMSGYDVAKWIFTNRPDTKVVLTSGYPGELASAGMAEPLPVRLLRKPYSRTELARALRQTLED